MESAIKDKSFRFAVRVVKLYQFLLESKKEFVISKQLLRSGTAVGALISEAKYAESRADFKHKMSIAQKEIGESIYWLELLRETKYLTDKQFKDLNNDAVEIIKMLTSIIKSTKKLKLTTS